MKRIIIVLLALQFLSGCAAMEHQRIQAERQKQLEELNLPDYSGQDNRNSKLYDAAHGAAWWIGTDIIKKALNKNL